MPQKVLIICGPTAAGKTALALKLASQFNGDLINVDSRQIFKGMDIGTGKDIPSDLNGLTLYGYDLVNPDQSFSAFDFYTYAWPKIKTIWSRRHLPILVGGTGLYLETLFHPPVSAGIPINSALRSELAGLTLKALQNLLQTENTRRWSKLNHSDQNNPRRLIRAIEITRHSAEIKPLSAPSPDTLWLGLTASPATLKARISARVRARAGPAFSREIKGLLKKYPDYFTFPAASATGYREWFQFLQRNLTRSQAIDLWTARELKYAKRQLTWFKKQSQIVWFDLDRPDFIPSIAQRVETWYARSNARKSRQSSA